MSSFTEPLVLECIDGEWITSRPLVYEIGKLGSGLRIVVPQGFATDLASIPRWLWPLLPPHDPRVAAPSVLHDYLVTWPGFDRGVADAIFYESMKVLRVPVWRRVVMYLGARLYWVAFRP